MAIIYNSDGSVLNINTANSLGTKIYNSTGATIVSTSPSLPGTKFRDSDAIDIEINAPAPVPPYIPNSNAIYSQPPQALGSDDYSGPNGEFTISCWLKFDSIPVTTTFPISYQHTLSDNIGFFWQMTNETTISVYMEGYFPVALTLPSNHDYSLWNLYTLQYDSTANKRRGYINDSLAGDHALSTSKIKMGEGSNRYGDYWFNGANDYYGYMSDLTIWPSALTLDQIVALYNNREGISPSSLGETISYSFAT